VLDGGEEVNKSPFTVEGPSFAAFLLYLFIAAILLFLCLGGIVMLLGIKNVDGWETLWIDNLLDIYYVAHI